MTLALIDKQDTFEIVRDKLAVLLAAATISQQALATAAAKDPSLWAFRVFAERSNPWEEWLNSQDNITPIVNVWYDNSSFDMSGSNIVSRQKTEAIFNIDCYAYASAENVSAGGHKAGDKEAALVCHRVIRLVRNILMAAENTYLGLTRETVWQRWPQSINIFQPQQGDNSMQQVVAGRIALKVVFNEFSPQVLGTVLEYLSVGVTRSEDGEILLSADFNYV